jgi:hypothetical protein
MSASMLSQMAFLAPAPALLQVEARVGAGLPASSTAPPS